MNVIVAASDAGTLERALRPHHAAGETIRVWSKPGQPLIAAVGTAAVVAAEQLDDGAVVVTLGSGVQLDAKRALSTTETDNDLVALRLEGDGTMRAVCGTGHHRLYRADDDSGVWVISSDMATASAGLAAPTLDRSREDFLLGFGFLPAGSTAIAGVRALAPGGIETLDGARTDLDAVPSQPTGAGLLELLGRTVERWAEGSDHHAVLLGGLDSALVAALLRQAGKRVTAYTFDLGDPTMNQANIDLVCRTLDIDHAWVPITPDALFDGLLRFPAVIGEPSAQPHYQLHTLIACERIAADGFPLVFTGDGCDAAFLGYPTVSQRSSVQRSINRLPAAVRGLLTRALAAGPVEARLGHVSRVARSTLAAAQLPFPASDHLPTQYLDDAARDRLRRGERPPQAESVTETRVRLAAGLDHLDPIRVAFAGNGATGASRAKVAGAVATTGVAQISPFVDPAVKAFAADLPVQALRSTGTSSRAIGKEALVDAVLEANLLPAEVVHQPKQSPATAPVDDWYSGPLRSELVDLFDHLPFDWDRRYVDRLLAPGRIDGLYRDRVTLSKHVMQAVGILAAYASFGRHADLLRHG